MSKTGERSYLIREDIENEKLEYFDFESMKFTEKMPNNVKLSTIDALTTMFQNGDELSNYVNKLPDDTEYSYTYKIIYITNTRNEEKVLNVVWNDKVLNSISKLADYKVDFSNDTNYFMLFEIIRSVKDVKNGLAKRIASSKKESTRLSDYNKKIIEAIACSKNEPSPKDMIEIFSEYKEYRALYLNYKINNQTRENDFKEQLIKIKQILFKEE